MVAVEAAFAPSSWRPMTDVTFPPTRDAARDRLKAFLPISGKPYAEKRNFDLPGHPHVSLLSPYIRHRLLTEADVARAVLDATTAQAAEKFLQEVFWRTYWKGWLEMRPDVWVSYRRELRRDLNRVQTESGLRQSWEDACRGETGIEAFDHWAKELVRTGYLHNHARMWFASIWIFTLRLPWALGADFFLRHLLDGDPASNTLSWRWVAGLQTQGKHYIARMSNISKFTEGRFRGGFLNTTADPLVGPSHPEPRQLPRSDMIDASLHTGILITEDDMSPEPLVAAVKPVSGLAVKLTPARSPLAISDAVSRFVDGGIEDVAGRWQSGTWAGVVEGDAAIDGILDWVKSSGISQVVMHRPMVGPVEDGLTGLEQALNADGVALVRVIRPMDQQAWPYATAGFFKFKKQIPALLEAL